MKKNSKKENRNRTQGPIEPEACDPIKVTPQAEAKEAETERYWIGLNLGDQVSAYCVLDGGAEVVARGKVRTRAADLKRVLGVYKGSWLAMEVGTHSTWVSRVLEAEGLRVVVANARKVQ